MKYIDNIDFGFYKNLEAIQVWTGSEIENIIYINNYIDCFLNILKGLGDHNEFLLGSENGIIFSINSDDFKNLKNHLGEVIGNYNFKREENNIFISATSEVDVIYLNGLISELLSYDFSNLYSEYEITKRYYKASQKDLKFNFPKDLIQLIKTQANPSYIKWLINKSEDLFYYGDFIALGKLQSRILIGFDISSNEPGTLSFFPKYKLFNSSISKDLYEKNSYKKSQYKFRNNYDNEDDSYVESDNEDNDSICDLCGGSFWCGTDNCPLDPT